MKKSLNVGERVIIRTSTGRLQSHCPRGAAIINNINSVNTHNDGSIVTVLSEVTKTLQNVYLYEIHADNITKEKLLEQITQSKNELKELEEKLKWMEENNEQEYSEQKFKIYQMLSIVDSKEVSRKIRVDAMLKLLESST